jgi:hypothetical protein
MAELRRVFADEAQRDFLNRLKDCGRSMCELTSAGYPAGSVFQSMTTPILACRSHRPRSAVHEVSQIYA